jgi:hypothetical protein
MRCLLRSTWTTYRLFHHAYRIHLGLTVDEIAPRVAARTGAEILAYENDEDLLVPVLWNYSKLADAL